MICLTVKDRLTEQPIEFRIIADLSTNKKGERSVFWLISGAQMAFAEPIYAEQG